MYGPMVEIARETISTNGCADCIKLEALPSEALELSEPASLLVSEIVDSELLGEGILPTIRHAIKVRLCQGWMLYGLEILYRSWWPPTACVSRSKRMSTSNLLSVWS